jgi:uncharacterized membrane protein
LTSGSRRPLLSREASPERDAPMIKIERTITIHRPVDEVFAYLSDFKHAPQFISGQRAGHKTSVGPTRVGSTFATTSWLLRRSSSNEITEYVPDRRLAWKATSGAGATTTWGLEPAGASTRVTFTRVAEVPGMFRFADSFMAQRASAQVDHDLAALKELLAVTRTPAGQAKGW